MIGFTAALLAGLVFGSLVEYGAHRAMHRGWLLARVHARHHAHGAAKGVVWEFLHYLAGTAVLLPWGFLVSMPVGAGWLAAGVVYALFSAYGHQLQHDDPEACFWMPRAPIHHLHHHRGQTDRNFGLALDVWDRAFGTYDPSGWSPRARRAPDWRRLAGVRWI